MLIVDGLKIGNGFV